MTDLAARALIIYLSATALVAAATAAVLRTFHAENDLLNLLIDVFNQQNPR